MKAKDVLLYLGILSYLLAIAEHLFNLGIFSLVYSEIGKTNVIYVLILLGTAFLITYAITWKRGTHGHIYFGGRRRPRWAGATARESYRTNDYDVEWHVYGPPHGRETEQPWADGPFCPDCKRELEEEKTGRITKKLVWSCPICERIFERPHGDAKDIVEKNFAAYLRKKGKL